MVMKECRHIHPFPAAAAMILESLADLHPVVAGRELAAAAMTCWWSYNDVAKKNINLGIDYNGNRWNPPCKPETMWATKLEAVSVATHLTGVASPSVTDA